MDRNEFHILFVTTDTYSSQLSDKSDKKYKQIIYEISKRKYWINSPFHVLWHNGYHPLPFCELRITINKPTVKEIVLMIHRIYENVEVLLRLTVHKKCWTANGKFSAGTESVSINRTAKE